MILWIYLFAVQAVNEVGPSEFSSSIIYNVPGNKYFPVAVNYYTYFLTATDSCENGECDTSVGESCSTCYQGT